MGKAFLPGASGGTDPTNCLESKETLRDSLILHPRGLSGERQGLSAGGRSDSSCFGSMH